QDLVREGIVYLHKSIAVNPEAHFGREIWQAIIAEFMLAVSRDRKLLLEYDMDGNPLKSRYEARVEPTSLVGRRHKSDAVYLVKKYLDDQNRDQELRESLRSRILRVGAEGDNPFNRNPVRFDEPCLGIIGMWRLGGGANPHFALALGETMMRVGQRHLAWSAYQRAIREAKRFSSDEAIRAKFIEHCKARQTAFGFSDANTR